MGEEKIEQNADRLRYYLLGELGCGKEDARRVLRKFIEKYLDGKR